MDFTADQKVKKAAISIVVTRKDGTVQDLGVVARYDADNPVAEDNRSWLRRALAVIVK